MSAEPVIVTRMLSKWFDSVAAVRELSITVPRAEIYAFLGPNGAGKTTTIRMLLGLIRPSGGVVQILGRQIRPGETKVFSRIGYLVEQAVAYPNLNVRENLQVQQRLTGSSRAAADEAMQRLGLERYADRRADRLSLGNLQRLALARALLHAPELLILDEPANGLDPAGIVELRTLLRELVTERGVTVFLSSHGLAEVAQSADRVAIVHEGRLLEEVSRAQLHARARTFIDVTVSDPARAHLLLEQEQIGRVVAHGAGLRVYAADGRAAQIARVLVGSGLQLEALVPGREDLESYFLRRTKGEP
jgi:ABC-2 type transport system ATP-binding protein